MKKIFTLCASALFVLGASAADPTGGLNFDGNDGSFLDLGDASQIEAITAPQALTVETWVKYNAVPSGCTGYIICNETDGNGGWMLRHETGLEINIGSNGGWVGAKSGVTPEAGVWYHIAGVYDANALTLALYLNGAEAVAPTTLAAAMGPATQNLRIAEGTAWAGRRLNGTLSDLRIWSVAKDAAAVAADMTNSLTGSEAGLVANWKMNEGTGTEIKDTKTDGPFTTYIPDGVAGITWEGTFSGVEAASAAKVDAFVNGKTLNVTNGGETTLTFTIYNVAGVKEFEGSVKAGASFAQVLNLNGVAILKGVTENGKTISQKLVF